MLARLRASFEQATFLFVSHDIRDTEDFERVLVIRGGRVVEDGPPAELLAQPGSFYAELLQRDKRSNETVWSAEDWRRARMRDGQLESVA